MSKEIAPAFLFPGQGLGSQEIIAYYSKLQEISETCTNETLGLAQDTLNEVFGYRVFPIIPTLKDEESANYQQTAFVQPVVYSLSIVSQAVSNKNISASYVAGHSLGEYSALTVANVITPEQGLQIVSHRGKLMQEACEKTGTRLVSVNGLSQSVVEALYEGEGLADVALVNAPDLIVVGCLKETVDEVVRIAKENGAKRTMLLETTGAFHTSYMRFAAADFAEVLSKFEFGESSIPVVSNLTGEIANDGEILKEHLIKGMTRAVQWARTIKTMQDNGVRAFYEVGPGNSLSILNKKNGVSREQTRNIID